jgi:para-aminobenzoate synthetase/4-amino-4-deoxychorismate lyase
VSVAGGVAIVRRGPRPSARPDPRAGVFETLLVRDGVAEHLDEHLERLRRSVRALYDAALPATLAQHARDAAAAWPGDGVLRLFAAPARDGLATQALAAALPSLAPAPALVPVVLPGGLGAHKWADRGLLAALEAEHAPALPLLVDIDGALLETTRTSVFLLRDGRLLTPPADGRILPGVTRAHVLARGEGHEAPLGVEDHSAAQAVFVASALRGLQRVGGAEPAR